MRVLSLVQGKIGPFRKDVLAGMVLLVAALSFLPTPKAQAAPSVEWVDVGHISVTNNGDERTYTDTDPYDDNHHYRDLGQPGSCQSQLWVNRNPINGNSNNGEIIILATGDGGCELRYASGGDYAPGEQENSCISDREVGRTENTRSGTRCAGTGIDAGAVAIGGPRRAQIQYRFTDETRSTIERIRSTNDVRFERQSDGITYSTDDEGPTCQRSISDTTEIPRRVIRIKQQAAVGTSAPITETVGGETVNVGVFMTLGAEESSPGRSSATISVCAFDEVAPEIHRQNGSGDRYIGLPLLIDENNEGGDPGDPGLVEEQELSCNVEINPITWIVCPLISAAEGAIQVWDSWVNSLLNIDPDALFGEGDSAQNWENAWGVFRNLALAVLIIAALVMIIAQATGAEMLDAYTIRRVLPRILVAAVGITLSWPLLELAVNISNDLGTGIRSIIYAPFVADGALQGSITIDGLGQTIIGAVFAGAILASGILALATFVLTAFVAVLVALVLLVFRDMFITLLIVVAPIAIACYILPNTQRVWKLWYSTFSKLLLMFLFISAFIATGRVIAYTASEGANFETDLLSSLIAVVAYFGPYFLIPATFRMAGGAMAAMGSMGSQAFKRMNAPVTGLRGQLGKRFRQRTTEGDTWLGRNRVTGSAFEHAYGRIKHAERGGLSPTKRGRAEYSAEARFARGEEARKALETSAGQVAAGDDDGTASAEHATSRGQFRRDFEPEGFSRALGEEQERLRQQYLDEGNDEATARQRAEQSVNERRAGVEQLQQQYINQGEDEYTAGHRARHETDSALAQRGEEITLETMYKMERGFNARMGSDQMRVTARAARETSDTAQDTRRQQRTPGGGQPQPGQVPPQQPQPPQPQAPNQPGQPAPQPQPPQQPQPDLGEGESVSQGGVVIPRGAQYPDQQGQQDQAETPQQPQPPQPPPEAGDVPRNSINQNRPEYRDRP